jgi:ABC-2 type transport system ATP-binding protein
MINIEHIGMTYDKGRVVALQDVSLEVKKGEIFGLIGPDGAGKTTLFRILTTLLLPEKGRASVNNHDVVKDYKAIRSSVGYMPGKFSLYQDLTIEENLNFFATVFGTTIAANYDLIKDIYVQIEPFKNRRAGKLSGGMKQKLALCCALIHKPEVLFLDEPTTGVDVVSRKEFWDMLKSLRKEGITILVSTPYMDEASLCDRIALIQKGSILSVDTTGGIIQSFSGQLYAVRGQGTYHLLQDTREYDGIASCFAFGDALHATFRAAGPASQAPGAGPAGSQAASLESYLHSKGHSDARVEPIQPGIEDCFIQLLNQ